MRGDGGGGIMLAMTYDELTSDLIDTIRELRAHFSQRDIANAITDAMMIAIPTIRPITYEPNPAATSIVNTHMTKETQLAAVRHLLHDHRATLPTSTTTFLNSCSRHITGKKYVLSRDQVAAVNKTAGDLAMSQNP